MKNRAFTLIELLVVISIVALLSSVVMSALNSARAKSRDTARILAVREVRKALELYFNANGFFPSSTFGAFALTPSSGNNCGYSNNWCNFETAMLPYISSLPRDNLGTPLDGRYTYKANSPFQMYGLSVVLEQPNSLAANDGGFFPGLYELGDLPVYCKNRYAGADGNWQNWNSINDCVGGD